MTAGASPKPSGLAWTLIYDGRCGFCRRWVERLARRDAQGLFRLVPFQDAEALAGLPHIPRERLAEAVHLVGPDGRVLVGAAAAPAVLALLPGWRALAPLFRLPGVAILADRVYKWVARNRGRF